MSSTMSLHSHDSIYSQLTLGKHIADTEQRLLTMSVSLHTETRCPNLIIQVTNTESTS